MTALLLTQGGSVMHGSGRGGVLSPDVGGQVPNQQRCASVPFPHGVTAAARPGSQQRIDKSPCPSLGLYQARASIANLMPA